MAQLDLSQIKTRVNAGLIRIRDDSSFSGITVCCYTEKVQYERLWDEYTSMARGLVFNGVNGKILSRPFRKFFNLGEMDENSLDWNDTIEVTEKLDGSLIVVSFHNGAMILNSKCSFDSEHAEFAKKWIKEHLSEWMDRELYYSSKIDRDLTFCFEAIFPDGRIVIDYGDLEQLVLLSIIHTDSGEECPYDEVKKFGDYYDIPVVKRHIFDTTEDFVDTVRGRTISDGEGVVIRFVSSNQRVKVKSDEYVRLHRLISHMSEKHILDVMMTGGDIESIYSTLPDELYEEVKQITIDFMDEYSYIQHLAVTAMDELIRLKTRREQALYIKEHPSYQKISGVLFIMLDGREPKDAIWKIIRNNMIARSKPEDVPR